MANIAVWSKLRSSKIFSSAGILGISPKMEIAQGGSASTTGSDWPAGARRLEARTGDIGVDAHWHTASRRP